MRFILALDQGSTKTIALVADATGAIRGMGLAGGACHATDGMEAAMARVTEASRLALAQAELQADRLSLVSAGMTGADWPHEYPLLEEALQRTTGVPQVAVVNDCMIAYRAGTDRPYGAVLCAGSGLNAAIIPPGGEPLIYGYYINNEDQGGHALGQQAFRAVFNAQVGIGPPTALTERLLERFQLSSVDELLFRYVNRQLEAAKEVAPLLLATARSGDPVAQGLVVGFAERLARYVTAGLGRYGLLEEPIGVVLSGGIFKADLPLLGQTVSAAITARAPLAEILDAHYEPVVGALLLGLERMGDQPVGLESDIIKEYVARFGLIRQ